MAKLSKFILPYLIGAVIIVLIDFIFFLPSFRGKTLGQVDDVSFQAMAHESKSFYEKTKTKTYWTNSIFGGMPNYTIHDLGYKTSIIDHLISFFSLRMQGSLGFFLYLSLGSFMALAFLGLGPYLAVFGSLAISFSTNHIGLVDAGHLLKIGTLGFLPIVLAGSILIFRKKWMAGFVCFTFGLTAMLKQNHIQMTYLAGICMMIYFIFEIIKWIKEKDWNSIIKACSYHAIGTVIAILVNIGLLASLKSYSNDTMRGGSILSSQSANASDRNTASGSSGLGWDYAMQWSNGFTDLMSLMAPGAVGGSTSEKLNANSRLGRYFKSNTNSELRLPLYWGQLPFTSSPDYLGIILIGLFIMGLSIIKGPLKWFALTSTILLILLSMGKNFELLNRLFFDYLPYYNKFRTPNSILNVLSVTLPIFSIYALYTFMKMDWTPELLKKLFVKTLLPFASILLLLTLIGPSMFTMESPANDANFKSNAQVFNALLDERASFMRKDFFRSLIILLIGAGLIYFYGLKKLKSTVFVVSLTALSFFDLWFVAKRYVDDSKFESIKKEQSLFTPRPVDREILKDTDPNYRVFDLSINTFNDAMPSYHHKLIGGYHPAKLRRYQDMIDYYFGKVNMNVLSMMNTKYIISQDGNLQTNPNAFGNAWFVSSIRNVNSPDEEIASLATMDLTNEAAILTREFPNYITKMNFTKEGTIKLISYAPNHLVYQSQSNVEQLALFSEVYYGPNKGWQAYIDDKPVDHIRANYILRALNVPAGSHKIEFKFDLPKSIASTRNIGWGMGMVAGLLFIGFLGLQIRKSLSSATNLELELIPTPPGSNNAASTKVRESKQIQSSKSKK